MGILDQLTNFADKAIKKIESTSDKVVDIYKKEGVEGFLDRADKGLGNLEKKANKATEQAASYAREIAKSNKVEIERAKKGSDDNLDSIVNSSVAVAVNTVSTVARDVTKKAKELIATKEPIVGKPDSNLKANNAFEYFRFAEADGVALEDVIKFIGAKANTDSKVKNEFIDSYGNNLSVQGRSWYDSTNNIGGVGAVSLLKYELDLSYKVANKGQDVQAEAVNILEKISLKKQVLDKEGDVLISKAPAKKTVKKPAAKKVAKVVEVEEAPAKKTTVKKAIMK